MVRGRRFELNLPAAAHQIYQLRHFANGWRHACDPVATNVKRCQRQSTEAVRQLAQLVPAVSTTTGIQRVNRPPYSLPWLVIPQIEHGEAGQQVEVWHDGKGGVYGRQLLQALELEQRVVGNGHQRVVGDV